MASCASGEPNSPAVSPSATVSDAPACKLRTNCVDSLGSFGLPPLRYAGTAPQAMLALKATLATFPEAQIERSEPTRLVAIFTTRVGFKDEVEFSLREQPQRIDFRSRSKFGLYDFGKNQSRMREFSRRFEAQ